MRKLTVFFLLIATLSSHAQTIKATSDAYKGYINNINDNGSNTLTINDHSFLMVTTKFTKPDATLTLLDTKYNTIWQTPEMENYIAAALFQGNILVISAKGAKARSRFNVKTLTATLLDKKNGQVITEKQIPVFSDKTTTDVSLLTDSVGNCKALLLRNTNQKNSYGSLFSFNADLDFAKTNNLQVVTFDKDLNVQQQTINIPGLSDAQFIADAAGDNSALYFAYIINNNLIVEKYNTASMKTEGNIKAVLDFDNDVRPITKTFLVVKNNIAFISGKLDEKRNSKSTFIIGRFNFNSGKGNVLQELEDRSYLKDADARGKNFESIEAFTYKNEFIVVKEAHAIKGGVYTPNGTTNTYFDFGPVLVSVYDSTMHKIKDFTINEAERIYYYVPSAGAALNGNKLYVFFNDNNWKLNSRAKYQVINLDNLSIGADNEIELDHNLNTLMYAPCIQWFGNTAVIPMTGNAHLLGGKIQTSYATVEFK
ncbi:MAG TPA: hypothetical protein VHB70_14815 [Parafilimonas sp.]|nr:hypothetical protein [Parafilimonas sp.]